MQSIKTMLKGLTHEDIRQWAGSKIFNRGKDYVASVSGLSRTEDGTLVAWVSGTDEYATSVRRNDEGDFDYGCTCPYDGWGPCKHVVAVLLAVARELERKRDIPLLDPDDDLYLEAFDDFPEDDDWADDEDDDDFDADDSPRPAVRGRAPQIEAILAAKSRDELQALLIDLAVDFPEVNRRIRELAQLETGQVDKLVRALQKEIRNLTAQDAWFNPWKDEGNLPDYSHVEEQLQTLLDNGHADEVFALGEELWELGSTQVEESQDEGDTALAIASCLEIVLQALPRTSLAPSGQLLWLVEHEIADEFALLNGADVFLNDRRYTEDHWREAATGLQQRLQKIALPQSGGFTETYHREKLVTWLCSAYQRSGEPQKVIPLLEEEADRCRSYDALVKALLEVGERDQARQWCIRGFKQTVSDAPGIASGLQKRLRQMAEEEGRFDLSAAYRADDFFDQPSVSAYDKLRQASERVGVWSAVRKGGLDYLQTGRRPVAGGKGEAGWPLSEPEVKKPEAKGKIRGASFPDSEMLIEIAILEERHDDAVAIYQELAKSKRWSWSIDEKLAQTVHATHPDIALQIWKSIVDRLIGQVKPKAYEEAAGYLRKMHTVYGQTGCLADWKALIARLRVEHKAKRRLMEVLNGLENR
ncbi:SWIM zinc finger domain-containing protein [Geobacter sp.]|uniref:SWIM zinc finger family protein n=1 Tax=Geobacter sp. TaxID=46610 RepID=UPI0027B8E513|nr:SWIM zinc finger family protein [Geobacter sp.]